MTQITSTDTAGKSSQELLRAHEEAFAARMLYLAMQGAPQWMVQYEAVDWALIRDGLPTQAEHDAAFDALMSYYATRR